MLDALALYRELAPSKVDGPLEAQILEMLSTSAEQAERDNRLLDRIRFGLLKNNFLTRGGRHEQATKVLRRTVTISPQGLSLPYLEQGAELRRRIKNLQEPVDDNSEDGKYSEKIKALIQAFERHYGEDSVRAADLETSTKNSADPLSEREAEVLQLIAQGHSSREIAEALVITYNTVRTHIRNIYRKLDVHSRLEAVKRGQELQVV